jgi:hypothetical protein
MDEQRPEGWGVRMPGWQSDSSLEEGDNDDNVASSDNQTDIEVPGGNGDTSDSVSEQDDMTMREEGSGADVPEIVDQAEGWKQLNAPQISSTRSSDGSDSDGPPPRKARRKDPKPSKKDKRKRERRERRERDREVRRRAKERERKWHEKRQREREELRRDDSRRDDVTIASLWKSWAMPKLRDEMTHDEMRLEWPIWRDMLVSALELQSPAERQWTEDEKYMTLMMHGGRSVRETASFTAPVSGEVTVDENGKEPKFSNLITRCNVTYRARDPTMEMTVLRNMTQRKEESVREFLEKARRQISLCGYNTAAERDRELVMLLKQNTVDAIPISRHGIGLNLEQMEGLAINLEAIRHREERQATESIEKVQVKQEVDIHAVMGKVDSWRSHQPGPSGGQKAYANNNKPQGRDKGDCTRCGRVGGHEANWKCRAETMECYNCKRVGHLASVCRQATIKQETSAGGYRGQQPARLNQVSSRARGGSSLNSDGWGEDWDV